ncbi:hypothetical protein FCL47_12955 [Desulfopila sp. IMCC35006]|uniref:hypothetical protein n=1 Tax=Desulfopila sp. IMCC35006 TaxID=2569542 RepID=UPI0010AC82CC|nr:hypothetical protein [Desulfopila sp. IMCC35006]TKB25988.1 hypothetical protein FCL47_12955 [Desulfopila sp. IMCC35006]
MISIIRKLAVRSYRKEIIKYTEMLSSLDEKRIANFFVFSVWIRSLLQMEGNINPMRHVTPSHEEIDLIPELHAYPFMLKDINDFIKICNNSKMPIKSLSLMLWIHTLRAVIHHELKKEINDIWALIMKSKKYWLEELALRCEEDINSGLDKKLIEGAATLAKEIFKCSPPKQILI